GAGSRRGLFAVARYRRRQRRAAWPVKIAKTHFQDKSARPLASNRSLAIVEPVSGCRKRKLEKCDQRPLPKMRRLGARWRPSPYQRHGRLSLTRGNVASSRACGKNAAETALSGWGARIRTWEWRNQNPLPYHLATPQSAPDHTGRRGAD